MKDQVTRGGKRTDAGRPELPEGQAKSVIKRICATPGEAKLWEIVAQRIDKPFSEWAREVLNAAAQK